MQGKLIRLSIDGNEIPCEITCDLVVNNEMLQVTNTDDGRAKSFIHGYYDWQVTCSTRAVFSSLSSSTAKLFEKAIFGASVDIEINTGDIIYSGNCLIPSINLSAGVTGMATSNMTLQGNGSLTPTNITT